MNIMNSIRDIPDFPKKGIGFKDITTLIKDGKAFSDAIDALAAQYNPDDIDLIIGIEARGFLFASALAYKWGKGVIPIRKPGKLPAECESEEYNLEYGTDKIEIHKDSIKKGDRVLIVDDLIATAGTASAARNLVKKLGGKLVECAFIVELVDLKGRDKLKGEQIYSVVEFEGE